MLKIFEMSQNLENEIEPNHQLMLKKIGLALREIRYSEGLKQNELEDYGVSRRQIQRGEYGCNISLVRLFTLLECYGYRLDEFFELIHQLAEKIGREGKL